MTVFEREDYPGGLLMYGIPNMKLDKSVIERKIEDNESRRVVFRTGVNVGVDVKADELKKNLTASYLTCGASNPRNINSSRQRCQRYLFCR
ncbi:MAG: hypothetical protein ACLSG9_08480 [Eubacterium sp.]